MKRKQKKERGKRKRYDVLRLTALLLAFSILLYPAVSNYLYEKNSARVISSYDEEAMKISKAEKDQMLLEARTYNKEMLKNIQLLDPFSTKKKEKNKRYERILNVNGSGMMGYIRIPKIQVELPVYHGTHEAVLQMGIGHFEGTSLPVGGESTHAVLTGHRGLPSKRLFTDMDKLSRGDIFYIKILGETLAYKIDRILTVLPEDTKALSIVSGKDYVTLVTCTPYAVNTHRMLVRGYRIPYEDAVKEVPDKEVQAELPLGAKILLTLTVIVILRFICAGIWKRIQKKSEKREKPEC